MKKLTLLLSILLFFCTCKKDVTEPDSPPIIENPNNNDDPIEDETDYVVLDGFIGHWHSSTILSADGNVIIVGRKRIENDYQMLITKANIEGDILFSKEINDLGSRALSVCEDSQQNLYVTGSSADFLSVAKVDMNGEVIWKKTYYTEESILGMNISVLNDNEIIVSGAMGAANADLIFLKIDALGEELSFKIIESPNDYKVPTSMLVLEDGNILITDYAGNMWNLTWYDQNFNFLWKKSYGEGHRVCRSATQLDDGNIITVGKRYHIKEGTTNTIDSTKVLIIKTDYSGELIWEKEAGDSFYLNDGQSIAVGQEGTFVINGYASSDNLSNTDHFIIYLDAEGNEISAKYFTDEKTFRGANIIKVENDRNVMTGGYQGGTYFLNVDNYGNL